VQVNTTERTACVDDGGAFLCRVTWVSEDLRPHRQLRLDLDNDDCWQAVTVDGVPGVRMRGCL
jgi:hypothetical protein